MLAAPSLLLLACNVIIKLGGFKGRYGEGYLNALPVGLLVLIVCAVSFSRFMRHRYRGTSLVLLSLGYFVGQMVISLAVWFGSCLLFMN